MIRFDVIAKLIAGLIVFGSCVAVLLPCSSTVSQADSGGRIWLVGEPSPGMPPCEEFYDKWEVPGAPPGLLAMAGYSREVFAAKACLDKNDVPMACKHWQGLLGVVDKMGPPLSESRGDIEQLMQEHDCEMAAESGANSGPESAPASEPAPESEASPTPESSEAPTESPDADK
jgi:hypothetical protein